MSIAVVRALAFVGMWACLAVAGTSAADEVDVAAKPPDQAPKAADGLRKVVAVARFENRANYEGRVALNDALADQLTDALIRSGQFTVLERQTVSDVMQEQDFANSGRVMKRESARTGRIVAAQILIKGTITEFEGSASTQKRGVKVGFMRFGKRSSNAHIGLMIRLIDSTTGEVLDSQRVEGSSKGGGVGFEVGGYSQENSNKEPIAKATQKAIDNAVEHIATRLALIPFEARVIKNIGHQLVIAAGAKIGAQVGDEFEVFALGEEFVDPYTGESLGREETKVGVVRIAEVKEKYSKANPVGTLGSTKAGDIIRATGRR